MHGTLPKLPAKPPAEVRSCARRHRPTRQPVTHIALPGYEVARVQPRRRETITALLRRTGWARRDAQYGWQFRNGLPTILTVNGEAVLRGRWRHTRIGVDDIVQFVSRPLGGQRGNTGKQVIGLVALIAVVAFAAWAPGALFGLSGWMATAATAGIGIGGSLLINTLINPKPGATNDPNAKTDQIYTASATGNLPKLGQPLPVGYGREKVYPDFAATPWGEFVGNDQYQNVLLSVGLGKYSYEALYVDDTLFWDPVNGIAGGFSSAQIAFYDPNEEVTLFPSGVVSAAEVTGQQLPHGMGVIGHYDPQGPGAWLGGYVSAPSGTVTQAIAIDFVFPAGCFWLNSKGESQPLIVSLSAECRPVNDAGAPIGPWTGLFIDERAYNSRSPIRDSIKIDVAPGRYEVRFRRNDDIPPQENGASEVIWASLRAFIKGTNTFPVSTIAIRIKGTETTQGSFKFGALRTRILPVWNGSTFVDQPTRNNAWAFLDAVTNEEYGAGHPISKADFNAIVAHAAGCDARDDHFDFTFSSAAAVPEALDKILTPSRARHFWLGDTISLVRDEWRDVPSMLLTDREIVRDSTQISWSMLGEEDPDAVILEYIDQDTWRPAQIQYPPNEGLGGWNATKPETKRIDGILDRDHAYREAAFLYLQSIYRRENVQIGTEYEGRAITFGSVLRVQSELPMAYGYGGAVVARTGNALTLDPAPSWADAGAHYIRLRRPDGKWFGPILVTRGLTDAIANLDAGQLATAVSAQGVTLSQVLAREDGGEEPSFDFGTADNQSRLCVVLSGQPNGNQCTLNLVVDDPRVHATDLGNPPIIPIGQYPRNPTAPLIVGLNASFGQGVAEPKLSASWFPAAGAIYYVAEVSYDSGTTWQQVYEGRDSQFSAVVQLAGLKLRVQAIGSMHGPYSEIELAAPTIQLPPEIVGLESMKEGVRRQVTTILTGVATGLNEELAKIAALAANAMATNFRNTRGLRDQTNSIRESLELKLNAATASIEEVRTVAVGAAGAIAELQTTVAAQFASAFASITTLQTAIATLDGAFSEFKTSATAQFGSLTASVTAQGTAITNLNTSFSSYQTTVNASLGNLTASVSTQATAIANLNGQLAAAYSLSLDVNGYISGLQLVNGGPGLSFFCVIADKFLVAQPGVAGGTFVPVFAIDIVNGVAKLALRGDMIVDGAITTAKIRAAAITTILLDAQAVTAEKMAANSITAENGAIKDLSVQSLKIGDNAVTVVDAGVDAGGGLGGLTGASSCLTTTVINTTGLIGKTLKLLVNGFVGVTNSGGGATIYLSLRKDGATFGNATLVYSSDTKGIFRVPALYVYSFVVTANSHTIQFKFTSNVSPNCDLTDMVISSVVCKR